MEKIENNTYTSLYSHAVCVITGNVVQTNMNGLQSNLVNINSKPSKKVHIKRNFTLTVARCMGVMIPGDIKVVHINRYFDLNVFVLTRFHCTGFNVPRKIAS